MAARYENALEVGLSTWHGAYNVYKMEGEDVDERRTVTIVAADIAATPEWFELRAEFAWAAIEVPGALVSAFGERQWGLHVDAVVPVWRPVLPDLPSSLNLGLRVDHVDFHAGELANGDAAGEEVTRVTAALALRPGAETVIRANYGLEWTDDLLGNPPARAARFQLGVATYF